MPDLFFIGWSSITTLAHIVNDWAKEWWGLLFALLIADNMLAGITRGVGRACRHLLIVVSFVRRLAKSASPTQPTSVPPKARTLEDVVAEHS